MAHLELTDAEPDQDSSKHFVSLFPYSVPHLSANRTLHELCSPASDLAQDVTFIKRKGSILDVSFQNASSDIKGKTFSELFAGHWDRNDKGFCPLVFQYSVQ